MGMGGSLASRGRGRSKRQATFAEINITPLTDVVLVLLIIFMVTAQFISRQDQGLDLNLPSAANVSDLDSLGGIRLAITRDGQYSIDGAPVPVEALATRLKAVSQSPNQLVIIEMDKDTTGQYLVTAMDAALSAGLPNTCLATAQPEPTAAPASPAPIAATTP